MLLVDAVSGVRSFATAELEALPPLLSGSPDVVVSALGRADRGLIVILDVSRLLPRDDQAVDANGAQE